MKIETTVTTDRSMENHHDFQHDLNVLIRKWQENVLILTVRPQTCWTVHPAADLVSQWIGAYQACALTPS